MKTLLKLSCVLSFLLVTHIVLSQSDIYVGSSACSGYTNTFKLSDQTVKGDVNNLISGYYGSVWQIGQGGGDVGEIRNSLRFNHSENCKPITPILCVDMNGHCLVVQYFEVRKNVYFGIVKGFDNKYFFVHDSFMDVIGAQEFACYGLPNNNSCLKYKDGVSYMELMLKPESCEGGDELALLGFWPSTPQTLKDVIIGIYPCKVVEINIK